MKQDTNPSGANIYILRPYSVRAIGTAAPIYINNQYIGKIANGDCATWKVRSGFVEIRTGEGVGSIRFNNTLMTAIHLDAIKSKSYYIEVINPYQISIVTPSFALKSLSQADGIKQLKKCQ